jgi:hypothetical protein
VLDKLLKSQSTWNEAKDLIAYKDIISPSPIPHTDIGNLVKNKKVKLVDSAIQEQIASNKILTNEKVLSQNFVLFAKYFFH